MTPQTEIRLERQRGFTLTEILVAISIFSVVMIAALLMYDRNSRVFKSGVENADAQQNTRVAFDKLVSDIRMMGYDYDRDGFPTVAVPTIWQPNTSYDPGDVVLPPTSNGFSYVCTVGGTSAGSEPSWSTTIGDTFSDGPNVVWQVAISGNQFQQPDEQIEFAGPTAITIRGNFDFESDSANENGREDDYESAQFPVVTTANDEIVTYALVSKTAAANDDSVQFFVDMNAPGTAPSRTAFPGGNAERSVTIGGIDTSNANPPYTLYRITFNDQGQQVRTPLADNIRSMNFRYYQDGQGVQPLQNLLNVDVPEGVGVLGLGQFNPATPNALVAERVIRSRIKSVRVTLVGMTENADPDYQDPTDLATLTNYRKYRLETLIAPRNVGKRGMREQDTNPPGPPVLEEIGFGHCGLVRVKWAAPISGGGVEQYIILYDIDEVDGFNYTYPGGVANEAIVPIPDAMVGMMGATWYFTVAAQNGYGTTPSNTATISGTFLNRTKPEAPTAITATPSATAISLSWDIPTANVDTGNQDKLLWKPSNQLLPDPNGIPNAEIGKNDTPLVRIYRSNSATFAPVAPPAANSNAVWTETSSAANAPFASWATRTGTWSDTGAAHCTEYFYRLQVLDHCAFDASRNSGTPNGFSDIFPLPADAAIGPFTTANTDPAPPLPPAELTIDETSACVDGACTVKLSWPKVIQDVNDVAVGIDMYRIYVQRYVWNDTTLEYVIDTADGAQQTLEESGYSLTAGATANYEVTGLPENDAVPYRYQYEFHVRAVSCDAESASGPSRRWPCTFAGGQPILTTTALDGSGTTDNPWVVYGAPVVNVSGLDADATGIQATLLKAGVPVQTWAVTGPFDAGGANFSLPDLADDDIPYSFVITLADNTNCTFTAARYMIGSATSCCLERHSSDNLLVGFSAGSKYIDVTLRNQCDDPLVIAPNGIKVKWSDAGLGGGTRVDWVEYPPLTGTVAVQDPKNTTATPFTSTVPTGGRGTIPAASTPWQPSTLYVAGNVVEPPTPNGWIYIATNDGTSGVTPPSFATVNGANVTDGTVLWTARPLNYRMRIGYTKNLPLNPILDVCVTYIRGADAATVCKVVDLKPTPTENCD